MKEIDFSIIIPVGRKDFVIPCLRSIDKALKKQTCKVEVILVGEKIDFHFKNLTRFSSFYLKKKHTSYRRNYGIKRALGKTLIFLDDDTLLTKDYFSRLNKLKRKKHQIITGPTLPYTKNKRELITDILISDYIGELRTAEKAKKDSETEFYNIYLCNVIINRKVFNDIGLFNEKIDYRMDDTEFFYRAQRKGIKAFYSKDLIVIHKRREFSGEFLGHIFISRFYTGVNTIRHPEIMSSIPGIRLVLSLILSIPLFLYFLSLKRIIKTSLSLSISYVLFLFVVAFKKKNIKDRYILLPTAIFLTHLWVITGFISGIISGIINRKEYEYK